MDIEFIQKVMGAQIVVREVTSWSYPVASFERLSSKSYGYERWRIGFLPADLRYTDVTFSVNIKMDKPETPEIESLSVCPCGVGGGPGLTTPTSAPTTPSDPCHVCDSNAVCSVTSYGAVKCECKNGFSGNGMSGNCIKTTTRPTTTTTTVDPCAICDINASCSFTAYGIPQCKCNWGYIGDGRFGSRKSLINNLKINKY